MKHKIQITLCLIVGAINLCAQTHNDQEKEQVLELFHLFFNSMRNGDTLTLAKCIHFSHPTSFFFKQFSGNEQQLMGNSTSTATGFLKSVADGSYVGKCQNTFDKLDITFNGRFAVVTAVYQCSVHGHSDSRGLYSVQMLKSDKWRIESVSRYSEKIE